jgi:hypothetical protein
MRRSIRNEDRRKADEEGRPENEIMSCVRQGKRSRVIQDYGKSIRNRGHRGPPSFNYGTLHDRRKSRPRRLHLLLPHPRHDWQQGTSPTFWQQPVGKHYPVMFFSPHRTLQPRNHQELQDAITRTAVDYHMLRSNCDDDDIDHSALQYNEPCQQYLPPSATAFMTKVVITMTDQSRHEYHVPTTHSGRIPTRERRTIQNHSRPSPASYMHLHDSYLTNLIRLTLTFLTHLSE